jgi:hypothetical protein
VIGFAEMNLSPFIWFLVALSFAATCLIWKTIFRADGAWHLKLFRAIFAAIPFVGPMLYIFLSPPSPHPPENMMPQFSKGTEVHSSFDPLIKSIARMLGGRRGD